MKAGRAIRWVGPLAPILAALLFTSGLLLLFKASPVESLQAMYNGAFGDQAKTLSVLAFWVPLTLSAAGSIVVFYLYNHKI